MELPYWTIDELTEVCLEALATGCVEGVPVEADPEVLASRLGFPDRRPPGEYNPGDPHGRPFEQRYFAAGLQMTRDWQYVTAFCSREHLLAPWECDAVTIRAYLMDEPPEWSAVETELRRYGYEPAGYTVTASAVSARVSAGDRYSAAPAGRLTDVTITRDVVPLPLPDRRGHLRNAMRGLGKAGAGAWPGWLAERELTPDTFVAVFAALARLRHDQPNRTDEWTALLSWFLDRAREANVFRPGEWTYHWVRHGSPPAADVSRACLDALPMTTDEARALPLSWREIPPDTARRARMTRALLRLAADAAPDPAAAQVIGRWRRERPSWIR